MLTGSILKTKLKMKLAVFALLLVVLPFWAEARPDVCENLIVEVIRAKRLPGDGFLNPPDPYVKVTVDGQTKQSHVITNEYSPVWNEEMKYTKVINDRLVVELWEYDDFLQGGDDHLATCDAKIKLGSHSFHCRTKGNGVLLFGIHCLKGNMKKKPLRRDMRW